MKLNNEIHWHRHHIIPRHRGGTDNSSNLVKVNIAMHAFLHKYLYEENGSNFDLIAWKLLDRQITLQQASTFAAREVNLGKKNSLEVREKKRLMRLGKKHSEETKRKIGLGNKGKKVSDEFRLWSSKKHKGKTISEEHRKAISLKLKGKPKPRRNKKLLGG